MFGRTRHARWWGRRPAEKASLASVWIAAVVVVGALSGPAAADPTPPSPVPTTGPAKYYVVGEPVRGQRESLFSIAAVTLGNGNRSQEIFVLNQDRIQPDGERLVDPLSIKPGWVLQLPADADGPLVRVGPVPVFAARSVADQPAAGASTTVDSGLGDSVLERTTRSIWVLVVCTVLVVALRLLIRGRRLDQPANPPGAGGGRSGPSPPPGAAGVAVGRVGPSDEARSGSLAGRPPPQQRDATAVRHLPMVEAEALDGADTLAVSLIGVRDSSGPPAMQWRTEGEPIGAGVGMALVAVGSGPQGTLYVDLARAPDVITMTGSGEAVRRQARRLAERLAAAAVPVTAMAGALGEPLPRGCRSGQDLEDPIPVGPRVVFCPGDGPGFERRSPARWSRSAQSHRPPATVVLVGSPRRSRWAIHIRPAATGRAQSNQDDG